MPDLRDEITDFSLGVVTSGEPDRDDLRNALVRADNAMFTNIAARVATIRKRHGLTIVNSTPFANTTASTGPAIVGGQHYIFDDAGTRVRYLAVVQADGTVSLVQDDGSSTAHTPATEFASLLGADITSPDFALMNNRLFLLDGKGGVASLLGDTEVAWGVEPATLDSLSATGTGDMTGDYDVGITVWNSLTNAESELSDLMSVTSLSSDQLDVVADAVSASLTHLYFRVYIRKPANGPGLFRVLAGTGYVGGTVMGFPLASASPTVTATINVSDATLEDMILAAPAVGSRGLPPSGIKYAEVFASRLFVADDTTVYWSEQDMPDAFNPNNQEPIRSPNGGYVRGLKTVPVNEGNSVLSVFTDTARHQLNGDNNPSTWTWNIPDPELGTVSNRSIVVYDSLLFWWNAEHGPVMRDISGGVAHIGNELIDDVVDASALNASQLDIIVGAGSGGRVVWAVPEPSQTRNTKMLSFNTQMRRWESTRWDPMDVSSLFVNFDNSSRSYIALGNYNGQLFRLLKGTNDGVRAGTTSGTFVAGSGTILSISDAEAAFDTTGAGLSERKVTILDSDGLVHGNTRPRITANTSTGLTLSETISGLTAGETYTYLVGGQNFNIETYWWNMKLPFILKRFDRLFLQFRADSGVSKVIINTSFSWDPLRGVTSTALDFTNELWDEAYWNIGYFDVVNVLTRKVSIIKTGVNAKVQLRNPYPDQGFEVMKIGLLARVLNDA